LNLGDIKVKVGVDTRDLQQGLEQARQQSQAFAASMSGQRQVMEAANRALAETSAVTTGTAERTRQLNAASRELTAARARLAEVMGGESRIAQEVAGKYYALQNSQRAQVIEVKEAILALELEAKAQAAAAAAAVKAQEEKIVAAGRAALAQREASLSAIRAAEAEAAAEVKAALAAGQAAGAQAAAAARASAGAGVGGALTGMGGLLVAGAVAEGLHEAVKASIDFNREMANVGSLIPGNVARLAELKGSVQQLAIETGKDTKEIATGAYQIISSFGDSADTAKLLAINTRLAIGGVADVGKTIGLTAAVTKTFGDHSAEAVQHVADLAAMTVRLGHTTLPELNASIGQVAPLASQLGVSLDELFGTLATGSGVTGNMSRVSTQLRGIFASFANPTKAMVELFNSVGVSSGKALIEQRGFADAVRLVVDTAEKTDTPLQKYFHRIEATTLALPLAGAQAKSLADKIDQMAHSAGAAEKAFLAQQTGAAALGTEWAKLAQTVKVSAQTFGDAIAPALTGALGWINRYIQAVSSAGAATGRFLRSPAEANARLNQQLDTVVKGTYTGLVDQARAGYLDTLRGPAGPAGFPVGSGGPAAAPRPAPRPSVAPPTKAQLDAHQRVQDDLDAAAFSRARQQAIQYHGELSKQVAALDLYHQAWEKLTGGQQKSTLALLANQQAEEKSKDAVKGHQDALDAQAKALQKAADERRKAAEAAAKEREKQQEDYRSFLREQQLAIREANRVPGTGLATLREEHPGWTEGQYKKAFDTQRFREFAEAAREASRAAQELDNANNEAMKGQLKQAQFDADSERAKRKYGEVNRESLALDSQWNAHYQELAPNQQRIIDQLYELAKAKQADVLQDRIRQYQQDQVLKDADARWQADLKEKDALLDLTRAMEKRRRDAEKPKEDDFNDAIKRYSDRLKEDSERRHQQLNAIAQQTSGIFENAFHAAYEKGPAAFFRSVVEGVEQMFQDIAAKYLASQLTNLIFGKPNFQTGDRNLNSLGGVVGSFLGSLGGGGDIGAGSLQNMFSLQSASRGSGELYVPPTGGGRATTAAAGAGGGHVTVNLHVATPDVAGFRQNSKALLQDAYRHAQTLQRRNG
jgi:TP901 family phage tail tape measure protein